MIYFYVHVAQYFITCYSNFFPLTYKKPEEKNNKRFKLNNMSVLTTWVDFVDQIPNGHLSLIHSYWGSIKILKNLVEGMKWHSVKQYNSKLHGLRFDLILTHKRLEKTLQKTAVSLKYYTPNGSLSAWSKLYCPHCEGEFRKPKL